MPKLHFIDVKSSRLITTLKFEVKRAGAVTKSLHAGAMMEIPRRTALGLTAAAVALPAWSAPRARLTDKYWSRSGTDRAPDHGAWDAVLGQHLRLGKDGIARFDYKRAPLGEVFTYIAELTMKDPTGLRPADAFAYWVNLYNAVTVKAVIEAYPVRSIRDIGGGLFTSGPWREALVTVAGRGLSLDDIEHGILRPIWQDPRVHYAVNCASLGCPNLAGQAYTGAGLDHMLNMAARTYVNHPRGAQVDGGRLTVSSIYHWFAADFGGSDTAVISHMRSFAAPKLSKALDGFTRISDHDYDWALND